MAIVNALQLIITNKANVPADLQSAGIEYKDLLIRLKYRLFKWEADAKVQAGLSN